MEPPRALKSSDTVADAAFGGLWSGVSHQDPERTLGRTLRSLGRPVLHAAFFRVCVDGRTLLVSVASEKMLLMGPERASERQFVALVCTGTGDWWPYARVLWILHRAGIETHVIAPRGSLAASGCRAALFDVERGQDFVETLKAQLLRRRYDWIYVGDEPSLTRLTAYKHEAWAGDLFPMRPSHPRFDALLNKHEFLQLLEQLELPVAPGCLAGDEQQARSAAEALGYPLAVKLGHGYGGRGVFRVDGARELEAALDRVSGQYPVRLETWLPGPAGDVQALFARGELIAWTSSLKVQGWPLPAGPSCSRRVFHHPLIEPSLRRFGAATQYHGLCSPEWALAADGGLFFLELNPRAGNIIHHDRFDDTDFAHAFRAFAGQSTYRRPTPPMGARGPTIYMFPQHVLYCFQSRNWPALRRWLPFSDTKDVEWRDPGAVYRGLKEVAYQGVLSASAWVRERARATT
jgi:hypothetical protein